MSEINGGDPTNNIPEDLVWDADNPPTVNGCSLSDAFHDPGCDGNCEQIAMDEGDIKIANERLAWARAGMNILSIPVGFANEVHAPGMPIDLFDLEMQVEAMKSILLEKVVSEKELNDRFKETILDKLQHIRAHNEVAVREARTRTNLGLSPDKSKKLLGPGGQPLG